MARSEIDLDLKYLPEFGKNISYGIGCVGAGFIMKDIHLAAYTEAGFNVVGIASRTRANAEAAAAQNCIKKVYDTWQELIADPAVEIVDIAYPPHEQLDVVREGYDGVHCWVHPRAGIVPNPRGGAPSVVMTMQQLWLRGSRKNFHATQPGKFDQQRIE